MQNVTFSFTLLYVKYKTKQRKIMQNIFCIIINNLKNQSITEKSGVKKYTASHLSAHCLKLANVTLIQILLSE